MKKSISRHLHWALCLLLLSVGSLSAQIGEVIWQEDFNNLENWIIETGNGS